METIVITCKNEDCNRQIRIPVYKFNSTIKNSTNQECNICKNTKLMAKSFSTDTPVDKRWNISTKAKKRARENKSGLKRTKTPHQRFYTSTAWKWFSRYVLLYYSINATYCNCCTCGVPKGLNNKELHTGHWIKVFDGNSTHYSTAFELTNLAPQCSKCNSYMGGRERLMQNWLTEKHGGDEIERLQILSKKPFKLDDYTLLKIADEYRIKFNVLLKDNEWSNPWRK